MNATETLLTCPQCETHGFTARGLQAHRCTGVNRNPTSPRPAAQRPARADESAAPGQSPKGAKPLTLATLDALQAAPFVGESEDALLGRQLSAQWDKVVGGQREQLIFGAMMVKLRAKVGGVSACGHSSKTKGTGLNGWLEAHAPKVARSTAYRLMEIAEGVQAEFRLGAKVDLEALLAAQIENLDGALAKKRLAIDQCIEGQSQRQLLLTFGKEHQPRGGDTSGHEPKLTPAEQHALRVKNLREDSTEPFRLLSLLGEKWHILKDAEIEGAIDIAEEWLSKAKAWLKLPKGKRPLGAAVQSLTAAQ